MDERGIAKAFQTVLVSQDHPLGLPCKNLIYLAQKLFVFEIHPVTNFRDPLIGLDVLLQTLLLKYSFLMLSIRFLRLT
jgi:hypothetical protein